MSKKLIIPIQSNNNKSNTNTKNKKSSLTLHIFLLTTFLLFAVCGVTYLFIAWATPSTFLSIVVDDLDKNTFLLLEQLKQSQSEEAENIILQFLKENSAHVTITNENGQIQTYRYSTFQAAFLDDKHIAVSGESEAAPSIASESPIEAESAFENAFPFRFRSEDTIYFLTIQPQLMAVNHAEKALFQVLPTLSLLILCLSFIVSFFYSLYITRPILRLSKISEKMAMLDFSLSCQETRRDEIGILSQNLNLLSYHLSTALCDLKEANETLKKDMERECQLKKQQTIFFSAASHELKTPITILKGQLSGMLAGIDIYQNRDKYLARSLAVTNRMDALVKELLTISRMESGEFMLTLSTFCFSQIIEQVIRQLQEFIELHQHRLFTDIAPNCQLQGDAALLARAISNLLSNAVLYSPDASQIHISLQKDLQGGACLQIENSDVTIPEEALPHLFDAFYRVETSRNRETGGSGLGLFLVKRIMDLHKYNYHIVNGKNSVIVQLQFPKAIFPYEKTDM